jgi:hypothetical protein
MSVDTQHPEYIAYASVWKTMRDTIEGHRAINKAGELYLPRLSGQDMGEYKTYLQRAVFFNAVGRVSEALVGMVFRKAPAIEAEALGPLIEDVTGSGQPLSSFAQEVFNEVIDLRRCGVMVDYTQNELAPITQAQAAQAGLRPYMALYRAEDIINWRVDMDKGGDFLTLVVLRERQEDTSDPFKMKYVERFRVLRMDEGVYKQQVWEKQKNTFVMLSEIIPQMNGAALKYIPFRFFGGVDGTTSVVPPMLEDMAYINIAHYRNSADLEHGLHYTGLPTAVITGVMANDQTYSIGSGNAWVFENADAKASFLEFTGQGLGALKEALKDKEQQMAALGARMLAPEKLAAESADSISQRRVGEVSALAGLAMNTSRGLTVCLEWLRDWIPAQGDVSIKLNTDFMPKPMSAQDITALLSAVTTGQISPQSFYESLVEAEVISGARTFEQERDMIAEMGGGASDGLGDANA